MLAIVLALTLGCGDRPPTTVDLIEVNHKHSDTGCPQFTQVILWRWSAEYRRYNVAHWFLISDEPLRKAGGFYYCNGRDINGCEFQFRAKLFRETWTEHDPERENLRLFPIELRR